jgi:hypothetical protein
LCLPGFSLPALLLSLQDVLYEESLPAIRAALLDATERKAAPKEV